MIKIVFASVLPYLVFAIWFLYLEMNNIITTDSPDIIPIYLFSMLITYAICLVTFWKNRKIMYHKKILSIILLLIFITGGALTFFVYLVMQSFSQGSLPIHL